MSVPAFAIDRYKVTNGQYLEFMRAGGYQDRSSVDAADWEWKAANDVSHPAFWKRTGDALASTNHVRRDPAAAFLAGLREPGRSFRLRPLGRQAIADRGGMAARGVRISTMALNADFLGAMRRPARSTDISTSSAGIPSPVDAFPRGRSAFGLDGLLANGWEWTATPFGPFEGFKAFPFYEGYSANFFDGKHFVMKGGSPRTDRSMLRRSFRNWFQPHYPYVYAGFRCASGGPK